MATGGLYGNSGTGALIAQPGTETPGLYGKSPNGSVVAQPGSESAGLYGNGTTFGGYYFEWFVFQTSATQPATPTGGTWNFQTDSGTAPSGWTNAPASNPTNVVWISIALVNSRSTSPLVWSTPGVLSYSGTINGSGAPTSGVGQIGELYIQTGVTPNALWFKSGSTTWTQITGSALYVDLTSNQTIAGTKTFSSTIQGNISGNAGTVTNGVYSNGTYVDPSWIASLAGSKITGNISGNAANVTGTVAIVNGGTGATTASGARTNLGLGTIATQDASSVAITGGSITGITDLAIADGGTGASTAGQARTNLGLGTAAVLDAGVANGVATLDAGGTVPLSQIPASIQGGVSYQGAWNASTNSPTLTSSVGTKGYYYVVSTAGSTNLNGVTDWNIGDWAIFNGSIWQKIDNTDAVTSVNGFTGTVSLGYADLAGAIPTWNQNTTGTASNVTGVVAVANGGTGVTVSSGVNSVVLRDANQNITANALDDAYTNVAASGTQITLTTSSPRRYTITGSGGQVIKLPDATTLTNGTIFQFDNNQSSGAITVNNNSNTLIVSVPSGGFVLVNLLSNSIAAGSWDRHDQAPSNVSWSTNTFDYAGSITNATWNGNVVQVNRGGTGASTLTGYVKGNGTSAFTASATVPSGDITGLGTMSTQNANAVAITGGTIDNTTIGATTPSTGTFTTLTAQTESINGTGMNLVLYSQNYSFWNPTALTVTANSTTAPDATNTASLLTANGSAAQHYIFQAGTAGTINSFYPRTFSIYLKAGTNNFAQVLYGSDVNAYANFDLSTGALGTVGSTVTATITSAGSGWYRCSVTTSSSLAAQNVYILIASGTSAARFESNSLSTTIYSWGAQFEYGSTVKPYLVTTTSVVYNTPQLQFNNSGILQFQADGSVVVQPAGTGALQAQATTSTATGGNARGTNSVDWQTVRNSASQVANTATSVIAGGRNNTATYDSFSGGGFNNNNAGQASVIAGGYSNTTAGTYSFIGAGQSNTANGLYNIIVGGWTNSGTANAAVTTQSGTMNGTTAVTLSGSNANIKVGQFVQGTSIAGQTYVAAVSGTSLTLSQAASGSSTSTLSFYTPHGVVVGGGNNQATGSYSFIGGGGDAGTAANRNVASGDWSVVVGGQRNTASGIGSVVGGGGTYGGGIVANIASGTAASVVGGVGNTASGFISFVGGGSNNTANSSASSICGGNAGTTRSIDGYTVFPACNTPVSGTVGSSQAALIVLGTQTTDATATVLRSNTAAASTANQVILPNNSAYYFKGSVIANVTGGGNTKAWAIEGAIKRGANAGSTALVGSPTVVSGFADVGAATWAITATADTTNGGLAITFTGQASTTIRVVAKLETTEVTF